MATAADPKPKSNIVLIKEYFGFNAKDAIALKKTLTEDDQKQLGEGIRNGSLTY